MLHEPPRLPEPLLGRNAVVIRRESDGGLYAWRFVWGTHNGDEPQFVGRSRADVQRHLQADPPGVPVAIDESLTPQEGNTPRRP